MISANVERDEQAFCIYQAAGPKPRLDPLGIVLTGLCAASSSLIKDGVTLGSIIKCTIGQGGRGGCEFRLLKCQRRSTLHSVSRASLDPDQRPAVRLLSGWNQRSSEPILPPLCPARA